MNTETITGRSLPTTIPDYLAQLRHALRDADPALVQDALYDAEEYLRSELAEQAGKSEAEVIAGVAGSYGAPDEVADIYRETEVTVNRALRTPVAPKRRSLVGRFFGVAADPHTYGSLFYMMLALATGVFYFTWVVTGISVSLGLLFLIIGLPVAVLFFGSVRMLSLLEGRIVETLLGVRMPRRPTYSGKEQPWLTRIAAMFTDGRSWLTMLYFLLMLPLGVLYFSVFITLLSVSLGLVWAPFAQLFAEQYQPGIWVNGENLVSAGMTPVLAVLGVLLLFGTLHLSRAIGRLHGMMAKHLLVRGG